MNRTERPAAIHRLLFLLFLALFTLHLPLSGQLRYADSFVDTTFIAIAQDSADLDLGTVPNKIILDGGDNKNNPNNLALNKPVAVRYAINDPKYISVHQTGWNPQLVTDGRVSANSFFEIIAKQDGTQLRIDLLTERVVNKLVTIPYPRGAANFRLRSYSIWVGRDTLGYRKVKSVIDNVLFPTSDTFDEDTCRYVMLQVDKTDPTLGNPSSTTLAEVEVYGKGYAPKGIYTCKVKDAGRPVNWGRVVWYGNTPQRTSMKVQLRTGSTAADPFGNVDSSKWSPWSDELADTGGSPNVHEPQRYVQYRVLLMTEGLETPRLDSIRVFFDTSLVASSATAQILPQSSPILKQGEFEYRIRTTATGGATGVDTIKIQTPIPLVVNRVTVDNVPITYVDNSRIGLVVLGLGSTVRGNATISVFLEFTPYLIETKFFSWIISNYNWTNPQRVDSLVTPAGAGWTLSTTGIPEDIIVSVRADPNPFTPNGDGKNDITHFSFFVSNLVSARTVRLTVFDITGRRIRLVNEEDVTATAYVGRGALEWDGRDDDGRRVPPGLYIYQILVNTDTPEPNVVTRTITVAY